MSARRKHNAMRREPDEERNDAMGLLNNQITDLIDAAPLTPAEVTLVLRMLVSSIERCHEAAVRTE